MSSMEMPAFDRARDKFLLRRMSRSALSKLFSLLLSPSPLSRLLSLHNYQQAKAYTTDELL